MGPNRRSSGASRPGVESDPARHAARARRASRGHDRADERRHDGATRDPDADLRGGASGVHWGNTIPNGDAGLVAYPVLDEAADRGRAARRQTRAVDETTGSFTAELVKLLTPGRIQASYFYKRVDAARFSSFA